MHTIKGFRVVQTFAMSSSSSDSGGKKSRIRRSKEERKTMVESFIKTYQAMNNGNFPSMNLTHKEVGGSFYTVREIVREIIQENRVLGPAMFPLEDDNKNDIMQNFPVGTIAVQPLICSPLGVSDILRHEENKQYQGEKGEHVLTPNEQEIEHFYVDVKENGPYTSEHAFDHHQSVESVLLSNSVDLESHQNSNAEQVLVTPSSPHHEDINQEPHQSVESELLSNSVEQESQQTSNAEEVLVTPSSLHHEDINQESFQNTISEQVIHAEKDHLGYIQENEKKGSFREPLHVDTIVEDSLDYKEYGGEKSEHILTPNEQEIEHYYEDVKENGSYTTEHAFDHLQSVESALLSNSVEQESHQNSNAEHGLVDLNQESLQNTIAEQVEHAEKDHLGSRQASEQKGSFREPLHIDTVAEDSLVELSTPLPGNNTRPEVVVEIFPPCPVTQSQTVNGFKGRPDEHRVPNETEDDHESKNNLENIFSVGNVDTGAELGRLDEKASPSNEYVSSEICENLITNETLVTDGKNVVIPEADVLSIGKPVNAPKEDISSLDKKTLHQKTTTEVANDTKIETSIVDEDISRSSNKRHPTLDRTKLETWEGTSEKKKPSSVTEIDSVVALFKAFFVAFVKFITK